MGFVWQTHSISCVGGAETPTPTLAFQFARSVIHSKSRGGGKILRIRALCGGGKPPPYYGNSISCVGVGEIPLLGEMSRSDKGVMAQP